MKEKTFEEFLQERHMEECPTVLDDDLPDAYGAWISERDIQEIIDYAGKWGEEARQAAYHAGKIAGMDRAIELIKVSPLN